jgi:hypothetical protein
MTKIIAALVGSCRKMESIAAKSKMSTRGLLN